MMTCLKITDPVALTLAGKIALGEIGKGPVLELLEHAPVGDGDFIPDHPSRLFHNAANIDYLAGTNSMDGHLFAGVDVPSINKNKTPTTPEEIKELLAGLTKLKGTAAVDSAYMTYIQSLGPTPDQAVVKKTVVDIETDFLFLVPTQTALFLHVNHSKDARTYSYLFNMGTRIPGFPKWMEAEHAEGVQYVFGKPFDTPLGYFPKHRTLSEYMIAYWTNFARTGDPNQGVSKVPTLWPEFSSTEHPYLVINNKITKSSVKHNLRSPYVKYWTSTYASLPSNEVSLMKNT
ncbi:hypothetical protein DPEC_G00258530 [Dallia pectoralis]|uniref:Uncharacterized protein n=1 Tax=Dallia pectoralis TaxID=75939 RepID=A0ACC2FQZ4_DALPE|nr:hypothetical protein DPEC_G00258530 [Dallia pectoralis]